MSEPTQTAKRPLFSVRALTVTAMLSAVAFILNLFDFPIPAIIPNFVKFDISDLPALLGAFSLGPVYGVVISILKNLIKVAFRGSFTVGTGEMFSIIMGSLFSFTAGFIYRNHKSRQTALIGALTGAILMAVVSVPLNYFLVYPAYVTLYHMPLEAIIGAYQAIFPGADSLMKCLVIFNLPFTLVKGLVDVLLCFLIYKPLSPILHRGNK